MRRRIHPRFWCLLILFMLIVFGVSFAMAQHSLQNGAAELAEASETRDALRSKIETLRTELAFTQSDEYIIRVARDELGMVMPGEIRYVSAD